MAWKDMIPSFKKSSSDELMEVPVEDELAEKINIRIENLTGTVDVERIGRLLKEGNIVFLKSKDLQRKDLGQFQISVQRLKRLCTQFGFDIAGTQEGYLICTPRFAHIVRNDEAQAQQ